MRRFLLIVILSLTLVLSGCIPIPTNNYNDNDYYEDSEPTELNISDFIQRHSTERILFFRMIDDVTKNTKCKLFVLENGSFTVYRKEVLELGKIARMSDDEIIEAYNDESAFREYDEYDLKIYTDDHGEETEKESIELGDDGDSLYFGESYNTSIYNTSFSGFKYNLDALIWGFDVYSLVKTDITLMIDQPYTPTFNGIIDDIDEEDYDDEDYDDEDDDDEYDDDEDDDDEDDDEYENNEDDNEETDENN